MPWPNNPPPVDPAADPASRARAGNSTPYRVQRHHAPWGTTSSRWEALNAVPWPNNPPPVDPAAILPARQGPAIPHHIAFSATTRRGHYQQ